MRRVRRSTRARASWGCRFLAVRRSIGWRRPGDPRAVAFPRPRAPGLDFSFSGVKTALLYHVRKRGVLSDQARADLAASYQEAIVDALLIRVGAALALEPSTTIILGGGVARNRRLREAARARLGDRARLVVPAPELCTDNAAMIGAAALVEWERRGPDPAPVRRRSEPWLRLMRPTLEPWPQFEYH